MKKILAISLAFFLFLSQTGFTLVTHYCGGHAMKTTLALSLHALDCGMDMVQMDCPSINSQRSAAVQNDCCQNHILAIHTDGSLRTDASVVSIHLTFVTAFFHSLLSLWQPVVQHTTSYLLQNSPPLTGQAFRVLFQSFLL